MGIWNFVTTTETYALQRLAYPDLNTYYEAAQLATLTKILTTNSLMDWMHIEQHFLVSTTLQESI